MTMFNEVEDQHEGEQVTHIEHHKEPSTIENGSLACVVRGVRKHNRKRIPESDDEDSDEDDGQLACSMSGKQWESLPFPIVIDSGACASVFSTDWCSHVSLMQTP